MLVLQGPKQSFEDVLFSASGRGIVVRAYQVGSDTALYWPTFDADEPRAFVMRGFGRVGLLANGTHLVATTSGGLTAYPLEGGKGVRWPSRAGVYTFACSPAEPLVVARHQGASWSCWRIGKKGDWKRLWQEKSHSYNPPLFTRDGTRILERVYGYIDRKTRALVPDAIAAYNPRTGKRLESTEAPYVYLSHKAILSPDSRLIAQAHEAEITVLTRDPPWRKLMDLNNGSTKYVTGLAFHPSGKYLAATSNDHTVKLYDTTTWEVARTFTWDIGRMRSIAFSPDGTLAAAGSDKGKVVVWDVDL